MTVLYENCRRAKRARLTILGAFIWSLGWFYWAYASHSGGARSGLVGIGMFETLPNDDAEKVFIHMISEVMHPWIAGIMLAAILSAIMSTIDSQLLVSSSALTEDFYQKAIKRDAGQREVVLVGRVCVIVISAVALALALRPSDTILGIVAYAWGGFGAAFGPLILFALFSKRTSWLAALIGMVTGTVVLVVWKEVGLGTHLYEIVPGFAANCLALTITNGIVRQSDPAVLRQFDEVRREIRHLAPEPETTRRTP